MGLGHGNGIVGNKLRNSALTDTQKGRSNLYVSTCLGLYGCIALSITVFARI